MLLLNSNFKIQNATFTKRIPSTAKVKTGSTTLAEPKIQNHQNKSLNVDFCFFVLILWLSIQFLWRNVERLHDCFYFAAVCN